MLVGMSDTPKAPKPYRPRDLNQLAKALVDEATGEAPEPQLDTRDPNAVALGSKGWSKGGRARAAKLTSEQRKEIARKAAAKRWGTRAKADVGKKP